MKILGKEKRHKYHISEKLFVSPCNRQTIIKYSAYITFFIIFAIGFLFASLYRSDNGEKPVRFPTDLKYILLWQPNRTNKVKENLLDKYKFKLGQSSFIEQKCKYYNCYITLNKSLVNGAENFDAIVFDAIDIDSYRYNNIHLPRSSNQKYIFHSLESSEKYPVCNPIFEDFFNLTWTYKLKSDLPHPYFNIYDRTSSLIGPRVNMSWSDKMTYTQKFHKKITKKKKAVAWVVSKCSLIIKHKDFLREFRNELQGYNYTIDIFGPCSKTTKCKDNNIENCYKEVEKDYFFNLILEDSYAEDYLTDRVLPSMEYVMLPIVLSGANYSRFLPPGSYVDVLSFDMKKLGAVVDYLIKLPQMYEYFFDWKKHYTYKQKPKSDVCHLCENLNKDDKHQIYNEFRRWWNPDYLDICEKIKLLNLFSKP